MCVLCSLFFSFFLYEVFLSCSILSKLESFGGLYRFGLYKLVAVWFVLFSFASFSVLIGGSQLSFLSVLVSFLFNFLLVAFNSWFNWGS